MIFFAIGSISIANKMKQEIFTKSELIICPTLYAPGGSGQFSHEIKNEIDNSCFFWDKCREQFAKKFTEISEGFFYSLSEKDIFCALHFIRDTEKFLNLSSFSEFFRTNRENVAFIKVHDFWKSCYMRRSLFTLICRLGLEYDYQCWEKTLYGEIGKTGSKDLDANYEMAKKTKKAIMRFFFGFTKYIGNLSHMNKEYFPEKHGWVAEFADKQSDYIKSVLILENNDKCPLGKRYIFGKELLLY